METIKCDFCGKEVPKEEATYIKSGEYYVCPECRENEFTVCDRCGRLSRGMKRTHRLTVASATVVTMMYSDKFSD